MPRLPRVLLLTAISFGIALAAPADWPKTLEFGVIPTESIGHQTDRWQGLVDSLQRKLGIPVELRTFPDYGAVIEAMKQKRVDIAYFGARSYVEAAATADAECFVAEVAFGKKPGYHSVVITRKGSGIRSVEEAKGKRWTYTDPRSTSGLLIPSFHFKNDLKIDPDTFFSKVGFSGSHEASILAVKDGTFDLAATSDLDLGKGDGKFWQTDSDFVVIWKSALIAGPPFAWRRSLPTALKSAIWEAFLAYRDSAGLARLGIKGFGPVANKDYDPVRKLSGFERK